MGEGWSDWYAQDFLVGAGHATDTGADGELTNWPTTWPTCTAPAASAASRWIARWARPRPSAPGPRGPVRAASRSATSATWAKAFELHDDGEIWAETLWDLRRAVGMSAARGLVTNGMRLSPDNPSFLEARDGIIQAAEVAGGAHTDAAWAVFAHRGMGYSASTAGSGAISAIEAFDLPPGPLVPAARTIGAGDGDGTLEPGESFTLSQALRNIRATAVTGVTSVLSESDPNVTLSQTASAYPNVAAGATQTNTTPFAGSLSSSAPCGARVELSLQVTTAEEGAKTLTLQVPTGGAGASQAFTQSTPVAIPDNTPAGASSTLAVSGVGPLADVDVRVNITHPFVGDLAIMLESPAGTVVSLSQTPGRRRRQLHRDRLRRRGRDGDRGRHRAIHGLVPPRPAPGRIRRPVRGRDVDDDRGRPGPAETREP